MPIFVEHCCELEIVGGLVITNATIGVGYVVFELLQQEKLFNRWGVLIFSAFKVWVLLDFKVFEVIFWEMLLSLKKNNGNVHLTKLHYSQATSM